MVGLAGESQNFDGNGHYVRFAVGGGSQTISTGKYGGANGEKLYGNVNEAPLGTRPAYPGKRPPYNHTAQCKRPEAARPQRRQDRRAADGSAAAPAPAVTTPTATRAAGHVDRRRRAASALTTRVGQVRRPDRRSWSTASTPSGRGAAK